MLQSQTQQGCATSLGKDASGLLLSTLLLWENTREATLRYLIVTHAFPGLARGSSSLCPAPRDPLATATGQRTVVVGIPKLWLQGMHWSLVMGHRQLPLWTHSPAELEQPWLTGQAPPSVPKSAPVG